MELLHLLAAVGLLLGNAYFVAVEFSITNARSTMVDQLAKDGVRGAGSLKHGVDHIDAYLSACQLGITVCSIGLGITAEPVITEWFESWFGEGDLLGVAAVSVAFVLAYALVSMFHVVLGELAPKSLAIARTRQTGLVLVPPMRVFYLATRPLVDALNWLGNMVLRPFGIPPASEADEDVYTEAELLSVMAASRNRGALGGDEVRFAQAAFTFGDRRAHEVMVPRQQVATLAADAPLREAVLAVAESGHRRLPVCERPGDLDSAIGTANLTDLARALAAERETSVRELVRPLHRTSEVTLLDDLLGWLRERQAEIALVVDEHDTALGLISIEDVLEEIVGDLRDEFDPAIDEPIEPLEDGFRIGGRADMRAVADAVGFDPGEHRESTIGGFVTERLGHVPSAGEHLDVDGVRFVADSVDGALVAQVTATPLDGDGARDDRG